MRRQYAIEGTFIQSISDTESPHLPETSRRSIQPEERSFTYIPSIPGPSMRVGERSSQESREIILPQTPLPRRARPKQQERYLPMEPLPPRALQTQQEICFSGEPLPGEPLPPRARQRQQERSSPEAPRHGIRPEERLYQEELRGRPEVGLSEEASQFGQVMLRQWEIYTSEERRFKKAQRIRQEAFLLEEHQRAEEERQKKREADLREVRRRIEAERQRQLEARLLERRRFEAERKRRWEARLLEERRRAEEERQRQRKARLLEERRQREAEWQRQREARLLEWRRPDVQRQRQREAGLFQEYVRFETEQQRQRLVRSREQQQRQRNEAQWRLWKSYWKKSTKILKDLVTRFPRLLFSLFRHISSALWAFSPGLLWISSIRQPIMQKAAALYSLLQPRTPNDPSPKYIDLHSLFAGTGTLLELLYNTLSNKDDTENSLVDTTVGGVVAIVVLFKVYLNLVNFKSIPPKKEESSPLGTLCVVCYHEASDTLLRPCNHLALCGSCCDQMGMKGTDWVTKRKVRCPICRGRVKSRMKIFRS